MRVLAVVLALVAAFAIAGALWMLVLDQRDTARCDRELAVAIETLRLAPGTEDPQDTADRVFENLENIGCYGN